MSNPLYVPLSLTIIVIQASNMSAFFPPLSYQRHLPNQHCHR